MFALMSVAAVAAEQPVLDVPALAAAYKAWDAGQNEGMGASDKADSGSLGWGESGYLADYAHLWEVTEDPYWLDKIAQHFRRIQASASDPDGDGYLSWQTATYSCAVASAERLLNVSAAEITPPLQKNSDGKAAAKCTGASYLIEFPQNGETFRIVDAQSRRPVAENLAYKSGAPIRQLDPFTFTITGTPHQGDRFLVTTRGPEPLEYTVHQGMIAYPVAQFIAAVKARPELQARFGADAEAFLAFFNKHLLEKNEQDWLDLGEEGGAYRFQPRITDRFPNRIMPHNQYGALARAWLVLKGVPGANPLMSQRAEAMVRYFRRYLELDRENDAWKWHYWDWTEFGEPGASGYEDTSHGTIDVSLAVLAARCRVEFTDADMKRFANTWLKVMWNRDEATPLMAAAVDGRKPYKMSPLMASWTELAQWDRQVFDLALKVFLAKPEKERARAVPTMLLCARRAGVIPAPGPAGQ